jgi:AcrR family transcriptional regulator
MLDHVDSATAPPPTSTHCRILRVAKELFANRGYEHTSTSAIARTAGTSESQLMKHFGSKSGLLEAIFTEGWCAIADRARLASDTLDDPVSKLEAIAAAVVGHLERDPEMKVLYLLEGRRIRREGQMVALTDGFLGFVRLLDSIIEDCKARGLLDANIPPHAVRSALMGLLEGMLRDRFLAERLGFPAHFSLDKILEVHSAAMNAFLGAPAELSKSNTG